MGNSDYFAMSKAMLRAVLNLLKSDVAKSVFLYLIDKNIYSAAQAISGADLCSKLRLNKQSCHKQCLKLYEAGVISKLKDGRFNYWYLNEMTTPAIHVFNETRKNLLTNDLGQSERNKELRGYKK